MSTAPSRANTPALLVLGATAFIYVTAETLPVGLLPEMSADLGVGESAIGLLLTFYAYAVAVITLPLMAAVKSWDRRKVVVITAGALAVSQLVSAVSVGYPMLVGARLICAATHGVFWAVVAPVAASLAAPGKRAKAIALVYAGTSLALVAGNPLTAALGQWTHWRVAAATLGVVALAITVALTRLLPALPVAAPVATTAGSHPGISRVLVLLCGITFLAALGHFAGYTYFALVVGEGIGTSGSVLSTMLFVYGLAGVAGIWLIGRTYDRGPWRSTIVVLTAITTALAALVLALSTGSGVLAIVAVALWGMAFTTIPVCIQSAVLHSAPGGAAADRASAIYVVTFQVAIATGALVGGGIVDALSVTAVLVFAAVTMLLALLGVLAGRSAFTAPTAPVPVVATASAP
ncbi:MULTISPECIES: MFS transporter [Nocardiaceae]|uniref:MFS family arabinose efflux permease n=1 Tax=Rhodococcoides corynebacterioides TaxID=53972 RepID=A0ABS2KXP9_9NOCA|nr:MULTISPECIES: MFS transporter [Rhodococcus]MBM7416086.1 putative MFS family arabinose efflux permease [Rhodococcus corynebacterioides]MBP1114339.1 putative MFS family arabinose efflux permease [Rhodococcus sp. PvP016]